VEAHALDDGEQFTVSDPAQLSDAVLSLSLPALHLLSLMDGRRTLQEIEDDFRAATGQALRPGLLLDMTRRLEETHFLEGPGFEAYYEDLQASYRRGPRRPNDLRGLGLTPPRIAEGLDALLTFQTPSPDGLAVPVGLIAPHLDYPRGRPCYELAYSRVRPHRHLERFVLLGTNHFGRSCSVVTTASSFETPLGVTPIDVPFLETLERRLGHSLRRFEMDHQREHSIEAQVLLLQHLLGAGSFSIVPFLCPDPCGATGTAPLDGLGVDLLDFARELGRLVRDDPVPTCLIAGADLSHTGAFFGPDPPLDEPFLADTRAYDQALLEHVVQGRIERFVESLANKGNHTRVCSAGCIYALCCALPHARPRLLGYHQAVNLAAQCSVSCAAVVLEDPCPPTTTSSASAAAACGRQQFAAD
jgi:AmmeMemoRadiSam system protein B